MPNKKLGEMLLENGVIDEVQLEGALVRQKQWGGRLGENLVNQGFVSEITLLKFLSKQLDLPCADLHKVTIKPEAYNLISVDLAQKHKVIPLRLKKIGLKNVLYVAMPDPTNNMAIDEIRFVSGYTVNPVIAAASQIENAIEKYYFDDEVHIRPLVERIASIDLAAELEIVHEISLHDQIISEKSSQSVLADLAAELEVVDETPLSEPLNLEEIKNPEIQNQEVRALIMLLDEKGILQKDEYLKKLQLLRDEEGD